MKRGREYDPEKPEEEALDDDNKELALNEYKTILNRNEDDTDTTFIPKGLEILNIYPDFINERSSDRHHLTFLIKICMLISKHGVSHNNYPPLKLMQTVIHYYKANLNIQVLHGITAVMGVAMHSHTNISLEILQALIDDGADVNMQDDKGRTALFFSAATTNSTSSIEALKKLLNAGANVNIQTKNGSTALTMAARLSNTTSSLETVKELIKANANVNFKNIADNTALMGAVVTSNTTSSLETVKILIDAGAYVNVQTKEGWTALMFAAAYSNTTSSLETVKELLKAHANVNLKTVTGFTALMLAARTSNTTSSLETVKTLIDAGAYVNVQNKEGWTALMIAAHLSHTTSSLETVKMLLNAKAYVDMKNMKGFTAFDLCRSLLCQNIFRENIIKHSEIQQDPKKIIFSHLSLNCNSEQTINEFAQDNLQINIQDPLWTSSTLKKKCWLAKNMITLTANENRLKIAIINYNAALAQNKINEIPSSFTHNVINSWSWMIEKERRSQIDALEKGTIFTPQTQSGQGRSVKNLFY
jgi:ankyrin repeat protein